MYFCVSPILKVNSELACWETEDFTIKTHCRPCKKIDNQEVCQKSGFIESVLCEQSGKSEERACGELPKVLQSDRH